MQKQLTEDLSDAGGPKTLTWSVTLRDRRVSDPNPYTAVVGLNLKASPAVQTIKAVAPHLTWHECAMALIGGRGVAQEMAALAVDEVRALRLQEALRMDAEERLASELHDAWRGCQEAHPQWMERDEDGRLIEAAAFDGFARAPAYPQSFKTVLLGFEERPDVAEILRKIAQAMGDRAEEIFGAEAVAFAEAANEAPQMAARLAAHAARQEIRQAVQSGERRAVDESKAAGGQGEAPAEPAARHAKRAPRAL